MKYSKSLLISFRTMSVLSLIRKTFHAILTVNMIAQTSFSWKRRGRGGAVVKFIGLIDFFEITQKQ